MLAIKEFIIRVLNSLLFFLPDSPFQSYLKMLEKNEALSALNWIIPVNDIIAIGELWCSAIAVFYIWQVVLRWVKAIE